MKAPGVLTALAMVFALGASTAAYGQAADGNIVGVVLDRTGASISGAAILLKNVATGVSWKQETDDFGSYRFNNLPVGDYVLTAEADGFTPASLSGIAIALNRTSTANLTLEIGRASSRNWR